MEWIYYTNIIMYIDSIYIHVSNMEQTLCFPQSKKIDDSLKSPQSRWLNPHTYVGAVPLNLYE